MFDTLKKWSCVVNLLSYLVQHHQHILSLNLPIVSVLTWECVCLNVLNKGQRWFVTDSQPGVHCILRMLRSTL